MNFRPGPPNNNYDNYKKRKERSDFDSPPRSASPLFDVDSPRKNDISPDRLKNIYTNFYKAFEKHFKEVLTRMKKGSTYKLKDVIQEF
jgi:hypothetical protein